MLSRKGGSGCEDAHHGSCTTKIDAIKSLDLEFEDFTASKTRNEILRVEKIPHDDFMWSGSDVDIERFIELEIYHDELLKREETIWGQRSRAVWFRDGDRNTKLFKGKAIHRRKVNEIT